MAEKSGLFEELKRRHVWRVAVAYAVAAWLLVQVATQVFPFFNIPNWAVRLVVILLAIGFPVAVAFAWIYEVTPEGIRRTAPTDSPDARPEHAAHDIGRKLNAVITVVLVLAVALMGWRLLALRHDSPGAGSQAVTAATSASPATSSPTVAAALPKAAPVAAFNPPKDTLVVLPFKNLSGDKGQQYFSDGITEELTDALGQNSALRVIAWQAAARFRDSNAAPETIGQQLNVANILNGSIAREGDQVRVTAELVNAVTGQQLWSHHYDDTFANIFAVQDKVSQAIASALQVKFAQADLPVGGTTNPQAHELVLKGRALLDKREAASLAAARQDFEQAIAIDPNYADAHALLSRTLLQLTEHSDLPLKSTLPQIRAEAGKALALDPNNADARVALGVADGAADPHDRAKAKAEFQKALALEPSNVGAHIDYGTLLPLKQALAEYRQATQLDPDNAIAWNNLAEAYRDLGDWAQMVAAAQAMIRIDPASVDGAFYLAYAYQQLHQYGPMVAAFNLVKPATELDQEQAATGRLVYRAVADPSLRPRALAALKALGQHQSNTDVAVNLLTMYTSLGEHAAMLQGLESLCQAQPIGCNDLAVNPFYTPLRTDSRFQKLANKYNSVTVQ
ncbi:MAG: tetratricopeptide repeat protein [Rhodanobacteraceae bacterium]|nr:MAG: tetratricopeptide repeat protein [Rhodanobacteraceae bacterium]